jgi:hypothetical protein
LLRLLDIPVVLQKFFYLIIVRHLAATRRTDACIEKIVTDLNIPEVLVT